MARSTSALDEAITIIEILQRIPKHRKVTLSEIQEGLAASGIELRTRTLQRYLKAITETPALGIECDQRARPYGYKQGVNGMATLSHQVSVHECLLLRLAQEHMRFMIPNQLSKSLSPLFDVAQQKFHEDSNKKAEKAWLKKVAVVGNTLPMQPPKYRTHVFDNVSEALFREVKLEIEYENGQGHTSKSLVNPLGLVQQDVRLYLVCTFDGYQDVRHLALHRIKKATVTEWIGQRPRAFSLDEYITSRQFNYTDGETRKVMLTFKFDNSVTARQLSETPFNQTQKIEALDNGLFAFSVELDDSPLIDGWLAVLKHYTTITDFVKAPID